MITSKDIHKSKENIEIPYRIPSSFGHLITYDEWITSAEKCDFDAIKVK